MEDARRRIMRSIDRGDGPALVVGAAGTGKSLLLQVLAAQYQKRFDVVLLACARLCTRRALLQTILFELGLPYRHRDEGQLRLSLLDHLLSDKNCPTGLLLLVDEAQVLSIPILDELRVMTNLMRGGALRMRLVLAGSSALEESFANPELESFSQRLSARCYLAPLGREETSQFIRAQVAAVGVTPEKVFAPDAFDAVFDATDGVPRLVNQLCDRALLVARDENCALIDRRLIQTAWADLQQLPTSWNSRGGTLVAPIESSQVVEFGSLAAMPIETERDEIEPTDLDSDVDDFVVGGKAEPNPSRSRTMATVADDPFGEEFDEEEVVLDSFAAWDEMFHSQTPRVENRRDRGLATLVEAALDISPAEQPLAVAEPETIEQTDSGAEFHDAPANEPAWNWPGLRLAMVSDSMAAEPGPEADRPAMTPIGRTWNDRSMRDDRPILIVEDESPATNRAGSPVRRLAYQHLFSRLRSG